ncbi:hypothetical protein M427DRAFT_59700 [Gonapodya prolifera JEL478]|uniref:C2H2-type domain-containing protein n=1 Tax=Gonapodya prolifera (strain JEL478) TaxID=1344416 RepID=A0A139A5R9_GONPJ|nr:hypothetical protein M427DRAFT_59700 [Gonapodya prolifera JEL478]|eukprot:KXS12172.1 hypothetical protein M427DRAFT_59700 [Gonapodya prolifera JEL478]
MYIPRVWAIIHKGEQRGLISGFGEKSYACTQCDVKFSRKHDMLRHQAVHNGSRPHECPRGCDRAYSRADALMRHIRAKHGDAGETVPSGSGDEHMSPEHESTDDVFREQVTASLSTLRAALSIIQGGYLGVQNAGGVVEDGDVHVDDEGR